ncbi:hypothetical protein Tco_0814296 [Tanacetum coccineum]
MSTITDIKSVLTQKNFDALCRKFHIPGEVHPQLPTLDQTIHDKPEGKIGIYTRFFDFANYRLPLSSFFVAVLRYFRINFSQLFVIGVAKVSHFEILCRVHNIEPAVRLFRCFYTHFKNKGWISFCKRTEGSPVCYTKPIDSLKNWNNRFFWVDSFACPALFRWHTNKSVSKDPPPKPTDFNAEHYAMRVAHPAPFRKFLKVFLCLVEISRYYPLDEETYPSFRDENDEVMDLSAFINVADPTLVKVVERERVEGEAKLLETTRAVAGIRLILLLVLIKILVEPKVEHVVVETEIVKKVTRHHKKRPTAADGSGFNHPPKKLKEDYGTSGGHASGGKSPSVIRELLASSILNAEVGVAAIPTLPFVTSSVSATPEKDGDDFTDAVTGPNLRTIGPSVRFVISPDSSHHSSTKATEAEVESIPRSADPPIMTEAVVTTEAAGVSSHLFPKTVVDTSSRFGPDLFLDSDSADTERPVTASTTQRPGKELSMGSREVDSEALHEIFVPRWNVPNDTLLDEHDISREFIDHLAPPVLFSQIRNMDYHHLFTEFNVGTARQACLNAEVRMRTEFCLSERTRLEVECGRQASLLKSKDEEIEVLKAQLTVKEAEAAEAIRLRAQIVAMERVHTDEVNVLQHNNAVLESEKNTLNDKVMELQSSLSAKDLEAKELAATAAIAKSQNDSLVDQVNVLEGACSELRKQVSAYESLKEQIEEFQDEQMRVMFDKLAKLEVDLIEMALHLEEKFYPHLLTVIAGRRWLLTHGLKLFITKCLNSSEYLVALGAAISRAIEKGMQVGLAAGIEHGKQAHGPYHHPEDQVVIGASSLTFSLSVSRDRVERIRRNIAEHRPSAATTTTALSTTFASTITIPPVSVDDYVVADVVNEENVQPNIDNKGEGSSAADINFEKEELDTTP